MFMSPEAWWAGGKASVCCTEHPGCVATSVPRTHSSPPGAFIPEARTSRTHTHEYFRRLSGAGDRQQPSARVPGGRSCHSPGFSQSVIRTAWIKGSRSSHGSRLEGELSGGQTTQGSGICAGAAWGGRGGGLAPQQPSGLPAAGRLRVVVAPAGAAGLSLAGRAPLAGVQRG